MNKTAMNKCLCEMQSSGSEKAFEQLYKETKKGVLAFIYSFVPSFCDAEDIMQQTYMNIRKNVDKYIPDTNALAWILEIAKNICINFIKKRNNEVVFSDVEQKVLNIESEDTEFDGQLIKLIEASLPKDECQIVILHLVTGLKHREIASQLEIPLGTVLWKYNKAINQLKVIINEEYYEK